MSCELCCYDPCGRTSLCPEGTYYVLEPDDGKTTVVKTRRIILPKNVEDVVTRALLRWLEF